MNTGYTVTVLHDGTMACSERIDVEVRFVRELERILGGADRVLEACRAALLDQSVQAEALRWRQVLDQATLAVQTGRGDLRFRVHLHIGEDGAGS